MPDDMPDFGPPPDDEPVTWCPVRDHACEDALCGDYGCALQAGMLPDDIDESDLY